MTVLYLAGRMSFRCRIKKYSSILYRPVHISNHRAHIPCAVWFPILRIFLRMYIFLDGCVPGSLVSFVDAKIIVTSLVAHHIRYDAQNAIINKYNNKARYQ